MHCLGELGNASSLPITMINVVFDTTPFWALGVYGRVLKAPRLQLPSHGGVGGGAEGGLRPCRATVPPHRVCRVTRGRRSVVLCEGDRHLCHLCHMCQPCHHDTEGGGGASESVRRHVP